MGDCTSLALVDGTQGELASLLVENQDLGVEPQVPSEDTYSATPLAQNEKCLTLITHHREIQAGIRPCRRENQACRDATKPPRRGTIPR